MNDGIRMQLSAYVDGELPENEAELLLRRMSQDSDLRQEVAEYLALGRLMRSDPGLAGADRLHERVAAAIDDRLVDAGDSVAAGGMSGMLRPLAGAAIAATVALVAIFALQQTTGIDEMPTEAPLPVASEVVPNIDAQEERRRQFFLNHAETTSELGANGMNSRFVTSRFSEELPDVPADDDTVESLDENDETTTQP